MECSEGNCGQAVAIAGQFDAYAYDPGDFSTKIGHWLVVRSVVPPVRMIDIPTLTPEPVRVAIERSFGLFWLDPQACGATIRAAIERLVDHIELTKRKGTLDSRLQRLRADGATSDDLIEAAHLIRKLGNAGAHDGSVDQTTLLSAYELIELELRATFNDDDKRRAVLRAKLQRRTPTS